MEQLIFFILGVVTVLLIVGVVVIVGTQQKTIELDRVLKDNTDSLTYNLEDLRRYVNELDKLVNLRVDREIENVNQNFDGVHRTIDSRLDKLSARIDNDNNYIHQQISQINNKLN